MTPTIFAEWAPHGANQRHRNRGFETVNSVDGDLVSSRDVRETRVRPTVTIRPNPATHPVSIPYRVVHLGLFHAVVPSRRAVDP
jgi:hypothetical protein